MDNENFVSNLKTMFDCGKTNLLLIDKATQGIQKKTGYILLCMAIIFPFVFSFVISKDSIIGSLYMLNVLVGSLFLLAFFIFIMIFRPKNMRIDPDIRKFVDKYSGLPHDDFMLQLLANIDDTCKVNINTLKKRSVYFDLGLIYLALSIGLIFLAYYIKVFL